MLPEICHRLSVINGVAAGERVDEMTGMIHHLMYVEAIIRPPFVAPDSGARLNISLDDGQERCGISSRNKLHKESSSMEVNSAKNPLGRDRSIMRVSRLSSCDSGPEAHLQLHSTNRPVNNSLDIQKHFIFHIYTQMPLCLKRSKTAKIIL